MNQLVVLGSVNADHVLRVPHFPRPGETLRGHNYQVVPGGKGANQAVAAARLGADTAFIARIGNDAIGLQMRDGFAKDHITLDAIECDETLPTGIAIIYVSDEGENSIGISAGANEALTPNIVKRHAELIRSADTLLLQLEVPLASVECAATIAHNTGTRVVLNPAPACPLSPALLAQIDLITPNQSEAKLLTGIEVTDENSAQAASVHLHDLGIPEIMITLGAQGVYYSQQGEGTIYPGFRVEAIDTTAAGDTFNGALLAELLRSHSMAQAIRFAHAAAALSVTRFGAQSSIPSLEEVQGFLVDQTS